MAGSLNRVTLIGHLGGDPEIRNVNNGSVANFSLATSETWKDRDGERQERTEWHRIVVWAEGLVKIVEDYLNKGSRVYVEGQIQTRKWEDRDGNDRHSTEVVLNGFNGKLILLDPPPDRDQGRRNRDGEQDHGNTRRGGRQSQGRSRGGGDNREPPERDRDGRSTARHSSTRGGGGWAGEDRSPQFDDDLGDDIPFINNLDASRKRIL